MLSFFVSLASILFFSVDLYSGSQPAQIFLEYQGNCLFNRSTRVQTSCLVRTASCIELTSVPEMENSLHHVIWKSDVTKALSQANEYVSLIVGILVSGG